MSFVIVFIILGIGVWVLNFLLGMKQIQSFNAGYIALRKKGKVAIGRKKGNITPGAIVLLQIEEQGLIIEGARMYGTFVFSKLKSFNELNGLYIQSINSRTIGRYPRALRLAILDAQRNYNFYIEESND